MYIKSYMGTELVTIPSETNVNKALDLMKEHDINRLPVVDGGQLVGLVTRHLIERNLPSAATSLSAHEVTYLLNKVPVSDIMQKDVPTIEPDDLLGYAATIMKNRNIGELLVMDGDQLVGIITDKDIFKAFVDVSGFDYPGSALVVVVDKDRIGVIEEIGDSLLEHQIDLTHMTVYREDDYVYLLVHVQGDQIPAFMEGLKAKGYAVETVRKKTKVEEE